MYETATTAKTRALRPRRSAARKARVALAAALMAAGLVVAQPAHASTTFTVNSTSDIGDPKTDDAQCVIPDFSGVDHCSLRAAIQNANGTPGADVIDFDIPGTGVQTIRVNSQGSGPLPAITEQVTIDGYSQTGAQENTKTVGDDAALKVELDGTKVPDRCGLSIVGASNSVVEGLVINRFGSGVCVDANSVGNRIQGNFLGTDPSGTLALANQHEGVGIYGDSSQTVVGGSTPGKRNVISGSGSDGVFLDTASATQIKGNYIGTDKSGTKDLGNGDHGITFQNDSPNVTIGGTTAASRNVISGNGSDGINTSGTHGTKVLGNRIGTSAGGAAALGNDRFGLYIGATNTSVGDGTSAGSNTIAFNGRDGIFVEDGWTGNALSHNSIFSNGGLGIDLQGLGETMDTDVATPNDPGDTDTGANRLQNKPVLTSAKTVSGTTTVKGKLNTLAVLDAAYKIEFYSNPSGTDEGKKFLGEKTVRTDETGLATFTFSPATKVPVGQAITATATKASTHDTSEFSAPRTVASS